jgi:hypothetical protein
MLHNQFSLRRAIALMAGLGAAVLLASCGGDDVDATTPEGAALQQFDYRNEGEWGRFWDLLYPGQQSTVSKSAFVNCNSRYQIEVFDLQAEVLGRASI